MGFKRCISRNVLPSIHLSFILIKRNRLKVKILYILESALKPQRFDSMRNNARLYKHVAKHLANKPFMLNAMNTINATLNRYTILLAKFTCVIKPNLLRSVWAGGLQQQRNRGAVAKWFCLIPSILLAMPHYLGECAHRRPAESIWKTTLVGRRQSRTIFQCRFHSHRLRSTVVSCVCDIYGSVKLKLF